MNITNHGKLFISFIILSCILLAVYQARAQTDNFIYDAPGNLTSVGATGATALSITTQPQPQLAETNAQATFSIVASGSGIKYQWLSNGVAILGATGDSLVLAHPPLTGSNVFSVILSNSSGVVTSTPAALWLDSNGNGMPDWWEMQYFGNLNQTAGGDYDGDGVSNIDEYREGTNPTNAASFDPRLHLSGFHGSVTASPAQPYYTNGQVVTLTAVPDPGQDFVSWTGSVIATKPVFSLIMSTNMAIMGNFGIPLPLALDNTNLTWTTGGNLPWFGQTQNSEDGISAAQSGPIVSYFSNSVYVPQQSWLQTQTDLTQPMGLVFWWNVSSQPPDGLSFSIDGTVSSNISGSGLGWQHYQTILPAGNHTLQWTYSKPGSSSPNGGNDSPTGIPFSDAAWVDEVMLVPLSWLPQITTEPASQTVIQGSTLSFNAAASGMQPIALQWYSNTTALANATNATLILTNVQPGTSSYYVVATNAYGEATSSNATLTVYSTNAVVAPAGLVAWWRAEGNALDEVGSNNGTLEGGATFAPGEVGQAFSFDGTNGYVLIGNTPSLDITGSLTIEGWVNWNGFTNGQLDAVVTKWAQSTAEDAYGIYLQGESSSNATLIGAIGVPGSVEDGLAGGSVPANLWTHVAMTYNATNGSNFLFVNGIQVASRIRAGGITPSSQTVMIAREDSSVPRPFPGLIDELSIYDRALAANEIAGICAAGTNGKSPIPTVPLSFETSASGLHWTTNGLLLTLTGLNGQGAAVIFTSADLISWTPVYTNPPATGTVQFILPVATNAPAQFYRAIQ